MTTPSIKLFGLIGYPLAQSFSNKYFTEKFKKLGLKNHKHLVFSFEDINKFPGIVKKHPGLVGLNVTMPHKETVIPFLNELDKTAKVIGAVNTIKITRTGSSAPYLKGYNTDAFGFRQAIKPFLQPHHKKALILGTGGASKAVAYVLKEFGIDFYFVTRTKSQKSKVKSQKIITYRELNSHYILSHKFIINATPVGMHPDVNEAPEIPYEHLTPEHFCFDLIYNPGDTLFMKRAKEKGAITQNGYTMLVQQAEEAWRIWNE